MVESNPTPAILMFLLLLAGCVPGEGPEGPRGIGGPPGPSGVDGADGTDGTDGADGSAILSGSIGPGESLSLVHGLGAGNLVYEAQFIKNGVVYDHSLYPLLFPPEAGPPVEVVASSGTLGDDVFAAELSSGNIAVLYEDTCSASVASCAWAKVVDPAGAQVVAATEVGPTEEARITALGDGGVLISTVVSGHGFDILQMDDDLVVVQSASSSVPTIEQVALAELAGGAFVVAYTHSTSGTSELSFTVFSAPGAVSAGPIDVVAGGFQFSERTGSLIGLADGNFGLFVSEAAGNDSELVYRVFDPSGTELAETLVIEGYAPRRDLVQSSTGSVFLGFEYGGPDTLGCAAVDESGALISQPRVVSFGEPSDITVGAFGDGDFALLTTEDDSLATMMHVFDGESGDMLAPGTLIGSTFGAGYGTSSIITLDDHTLAFFQVDYSNDRVALTTLTKGHLQLRAASGAQVELHNFTPETLDVTVAAHRTP